jgi:hypothetical protein
VKNYSYKNLFARKSNQILIVTLAFHYAILLWALPFCNFFFGLSSFSMITKKASTSKVARCNDPLLADLSFTVLPRGRNFSRKTQKGPKKIVWGRENLGPNFSQIYQKRAEKVPNFFVVWFCTKTVIFLAGNL